MMNLFKRKTLRQEMAEYDAVLLKRWEDLGMNEGIKMILKRIQND